MRRFLAVILVALLATSGAAPATAGGSKSLEVTVLQGGVPDPGALVILLAADGGKPQATANSQGQSILDLANVAIKPERVQIVVEDCRGNDTVYLVDRGAAIPRQKEDCNLAAIGWWNTKGTLVVDVQKKTFQVQDAGLSGTTKVIGGSTLVVAVVGGLALAGGGSSTGTQQGGANTGQTSAPATVTGTVVIDHAGVFVTYSLTGRPGLDGRRAGMFEVTATNCAGSVPGQRFPMQLMASGFGGGTLRAGDTYTGTAAFTIPGIGAATGQVTITANANATVTIVERVTSTSQACFQDLRAADLLPL